MTARKDPPALIDNVLVFELWILLLELSITGQQCFHALRINGVNSSRLRIRAGGAVSIFEWWILIPRIIFWLATPSYYSSHGYRFFDCLFGPQCREIA
jgi:hypothetical protein